MNKKINMFHIDNHESFQMLFVGDTCFGENYQETIKKRGGVNILEQYGYAYPLEKVKPLMMESQLVVLNLDAPITDLKKSPYEDEKDFVHWAHVEKAPEALLKHNVSVVTLANHHMFDYGQPGFEQTLAVLHRKGFTTLGAGKD